MAEQTGQDTNEFWQFAKDNWHLPAGVIGGGVAGSAFFGGTIGNLFGEDSGWKRFWTVVGGVAGAVAGVFGLSALVGDDRAENLAEDAVAAVSPDAADELDTALDNLSQDIVNTKDAFVDFAKEALEKTEEAANELYEQLDGIDGELGDGINATLPQIKQEITQRGQ